VAEVSKRLEVLSPERRRLVEQLLKDARDGVAVLSAAPAANDWAAASTPAPEPDADALRLEYGKTTDEAKQNFRRFYNEVSQQLDSSQFGSFSYFLNYGYVPDGSREYAAVQLPETYFNKNSVKLVLEVVGDCPIDGQRLLDVGCGRGGTVFTLQQFFRPASAVGLDLSANAIHFCNRVHRYSGVSFREGDAEQLPFPDGSFDAVINIESSHTYPNIRSFYLEVDRVLAPGGHFLYTDVLPRGKSDECVGLLESLGFSIVHQRDITGNVLRSCDEIAASRVQAFQGGNDATLVRNFLAAPGSRVYEEMKSRAWVYRLFKLRRRAER
jgi:phthiocerol/phenolphthiocerol synthesis type-I polyketide synthase E